MPIVFSVVNLEIEVDRIAGVVLLNSNFNGFAAVDDRCLALPGAEGRALEQDADEDGAAFSRVGQVDEKVPCYGALCAFHGCLSVFAVGQVLGDMSWKQEEINSALGCCTLGLNSFSVENSSEVDAA